VVDNDSVIVVLTQAGCVYCDDAQDVAARLAREFGLRVMSLDLDAPEGRAMADRGGILFPPGIFLDGDAISYGRPSERRLRRIVEGRLASGSARAHE
jgi:glutaredoxin